MVLSDERKAHADDDPCDDWSGLPIPKPKG